MLRPQEIISQHAPPRGLTDWRIGSPANIAAITACYLAAGVFAFVAWQFTGNDAWVNEFFGGPAALLMIWLAALQLSLSLKATRFFVSDDLLRPGWMLITLSAGCQFVGSILSQVLGVNSSLNPLMLRSGRPDWLILEFRHIGLGIGGTLRFALLSAGLHYAVKAYRKHGLLSPLKFIDTLVLACMVSYIGRNVADIVFAIAHGKHPDAWELLGWPTDPMIGLLLAQALLLLRSAQKMGTGVFARCWKAFSVGVFLTALGDVGQWATNYGYLPHPWDALTWYLWLPAAAAFACAPAFQLEVIRKAGISANRS